jgi:hypothetical protein
MCLIIIDVIGQFLVHGIVLDRLVEEIYTLKIVHILVNALKFRLSIPDLKQKILLLLDYGLKLKLALFITSTDDVELILQILSSQIMLTNLVLQIVDLSPKYHVHLAILIELEAFVG